MTLTSPLSREMTTVQKGPRHRYYKRQKLEIETHATELVQLNAALKREEALKKGKKKSEAGQIKSKSMWRVVARHYRRKLFVSEEKRQWLHAAVKGKALLIDDLLRVVRQQTKIASIIGDQTAEVPADILYAMDIQEINALYKQTDIIFSACGLDPTSVDTTPFQRSITRTCDGIAIQNVRRQYFAFSYTQACQANWMLSHLTHWQQDREDYLGIDDPSNTIATKFRISKNFPGGVWVSLRKRFVLRQFKEDTRTILVWKAHSAGEEAWLGMETVETGWAIIRPSSSVPGTVMELCLKLVPGHLNSAYEFPGNPFDTSLQSIVQRDTEEVSNGANTLLLEHMLTGIHA
ncbi:hypothetical protein P3T76_014959 [Phytophthora citrophthora]|uniref:Uncharacterized protein n=1 Tax=Phytophthora citrophthora TaxID=4793 RepID=A0AAD9G0I5_9STRA|nr:hypothetical protein P3T76_014959 [Phytophthora citrophthora]